MEERHLYHDLWDGYGKLMRAYGKKLVMLLNKGWNGPHDYHGRWVVQGETLGWRGKPLPTHFRSTEYPQNRQTHKGKSRSEEAISRMVLPSVEGNSARWPSRAHYTDCKWLRLLGLNCNKVAEGEDLYSNVLSQIYVAALRCNSNCFYSGATSTAPASHVRHF